MINGVGDGNSSSPKHAHPLPKPTNFLSLDIKFPTIFAGELDLARRRKKKDRKTKHSNRRSSAGRLCGLPRPAMKQS